MSKFYELREKSDTKHFFCFGIGIENAVCICATSQNNKLAVLFSQRFFLSKIVFSCNGDVSDVMKRTNLCKNQDHTQRKRWTNKKNGIGELMENRIR